MNYYNENDPKAAAWLRELICQGLISEGVVDERSIVDVLPADLQGYHQCHFFAGIGGWSYALRLAGVPDDEPVWTGSCPCQPFSNAGKQLGIADARHLWPIFFNLIRECKPPTVFGEQVASKAGRDWLAGIFADLEGMGYCRAAADLCAASVSAPHPRQRLYWVGHTDSAGPQQGRQAATTNGHRRSALANGDSRRLAYSNGRQCRNGGLQSSGQHGLKPEDSDAMRMGDTNSSASERFGRDSGQMVSRDEKSNGHHAPSAWSRFDILPCADGKARRIESGTFPLAHGISGRVGLLRGYGNAIVPQVASEFIQAFYEAISNG